MDYNQDKQRIYAMTWGDSTSPIHYGSKCR
jgi:hypothetical protein